MSDSIPPLNLPPLREHDFQSAVPVVGTLIRSVRRGLYSLTAKWSMRSLIHQQTDINAALAQQVNVLVAQVNVLVAQVNVLVAQVEALNGQAAERDVWLIEQDHEVVALTRTVAKLQAQVAWTAKRHPARLDNDSPDPELTESGRHG